MELAAWHVQRNCKQKGVDWQFKQLMLVLSLKDFILSSCKYLAFTDYQPPSGGVQLPFVMRSTKPFHAID